MPGRFDQLAFGVVHAPFSDLLVVNEPAFVIQRTVRMVTLLEYAVLQLSVCVVFASVNLHRYEYAGSSGGVKPSVSTARPNGLPAKRELARTRRPEMLPKGRTATGPRSQQIEAEKVAANSGDFRRVRVLRHLALRPYSRRFGTCANRIRLRHALGSNIAGAGRRLRLLNRVACKQEVPCGLFSP